MAQGRTVQTVQEPPGEASAPHEVRLDNQSALESLKLLKEKKCYN